MNKELFETQNKIQEWYQKLSPENLNLLHEFYSLDAEFVDPFHHFKSRQKLFEIYLKMFQKLKSPKFKITKTFSNELEWVVFWDFTFNQNFKIKGMTLFVFNSKHKIIGHYDYWDSISEFWIKLPIIGTIIKLFYKILF